MSVFLCRLANAAPLTIDIVWGRAHIQLWGSCLVTRAVLGYIVLHSSEDAVLNQLQADRHGLRGQAGVFLLILTLSTKKSSAWWDR